VDLREKIVATDPQDAVARPDLARAYARLGMIHKALGDLAATRQDRLKSLRLNQELAGVSRSDFVAQTHLAANYHDLGINEMDARDYEKAAEWFQQGVTLLQDLQAESQHKDLRVYQGWLASMQHKLTACREARRAIDDIDFALAQPAALAADLLFIRAAVFAGRGKHIAAAAAAEKLHTLDLKNTDYLYDAACAYALCVASVGRGKPPDLLTPEEVATKNRYAARAIEILAALIQLGFKDVVRIETDPDFAAIRQEEAYRALLAPLNASLKKSK
jgi:tetratricopeptide (TPR) repeat protein